MRVFALFLLTLLCASTSHAQNLTGRLVYIQNGAAYVLAPPNGKPQLLPNSRGARLVSIAPVGGTIVYNVKPNRAFFIRPPYRNARTLPAALAKFEIGNVQWSRDGSKALLSSWDKSYLWQPSNGSVRALPGGEAAISNDAKLLAYATEKELRLREIATGKERVLFSTAKPQSLFDALKRAENAKNIADLTGAISHDLWKQPMMWNFGSQAFSADGKTLWFACNAGTGAGAAGNTTYCWFACNVNSGRFAVLSKLGAQFSRLPQDVQLSPDGKKLLAVLSIHSSAVENPCVVTVIDLLTQKSRDVLNWKEVKKMDANLVYGTAWSPNSDALAISALFYNIAQTIKDENWEPRNSDHTLYIRDLNGRTRKAIRGAVQPGWGR